MRLQQYHIETSVGSIAVYVRRIASDAVPIILLHGVYFDHHMWDYHVSHIEDRTTIAIDMPWHGRSKERIIENWSLENCTEMLLEILDSLGIQRVLAVGHSWGSMTILRAAHVHPERFAAIGLCNMPFQASSMVRNMLFRLNHTLLGLRDFYTLQVAKALFGTQALREEPSLLAPLQRPMDVLSDEQIRHIDTTVIVRARDTSEMLANVTVKALALRGDEDYVPVPPNTIETIHVKGGHVSPLEQPEHVLRLITKLTSFDTHKR
jgi:3-oxoadipate enol-lactonase